MSWLFGGKAPAPAPTPPRPAQRPSVTGIPQGQAQSFNTNAPRQVGGYDAPKAGSSFGFLAAPAPAPGPAPAPSGFSFVSSAPVDVAPAPTSGFSFGGPSPAIDPLPTAPTASIGGFSFMQSAPVEPPAPAPVPTDLFGTAAQPLSFAAPLQSETTAIPLFPAASTETALPSGGMPLFPSALKAAPVKKKRAAKKPGFAREDDGDADAPDAVGSSKATPDLPQSPLDVERSRAASEVADTPVVNRTLPIDEPTPSLFLQSFNTPVSTELPVSMLSGLSVKAVPEPQPSFLSGLSVKQTPEPTPAQPSFLSGLSVKQPDAPPAQPSLLSGLTLKVSEPVSATATPDVPSEGIPSPVYDTPDAPMQVSSTVSHSFDVEDAEEDAPVIVEQDTPPPTREDTPPSPVYQPPPKPVQPEAPAPSAFAFVPKTVSAEDKFKSIITHVDTVARQCKLQLYDLKSKKAATTATATTLVSRITQLRASIRKAEADQNSAIESEDFARAEALDSTIAEWKSELDAAERKQSSLASEVKRIDDSIDAQFQAGFAAVTDTVLQLQTHVEQRESALATYLADSEKRLRLAADRIANEEEQLRLKQEHVDLDEKLVTEEQQQVESAIGAQTSENMAIVRELTDKHDTLKTEIASLEALLKQKRAEEASTATRLAEVQAKVSTIRAKFSKQLDRLRTKRNLVDTEQRECAVETEAVAKARRELDERKREDADHLAKSRGHIALASAEAAVVTQLREAMTIVSEKRRQRLGGVISATNATSVLKKLQETLDDAVNQLRALTKKRSELDGIVARCLANISAIDGKLPALNEEKKAVVAARKFKEAAKVQADIKQLTEEKAEEESKQADTVRAIEVCDAELERLKASIESYRSRVSTLEAEADTEKMRDLRETVADIRRRIRHLGKVGGRSQDSANSSAFSAAVVLLEGENTLAQEELTVLCVKHGTSSALPDETDSEAEEEVAVPEPVVAPVPTPAAVAVTPVAPQQEEDLLFELPSDDAVTKTEDVVFVPEPVVEVVEAVAEPVAAAVVVLREPTDIQADIDAVKDGIAEAEAAVEAAIGQEDFETADTLQGDVDAKTAQLAALEAELAAAVSSSS